MTLGDTRDDARLLAAIREVVPSGRRWHLHGSPPCQLFSSMRNITKRRDGKGGMRLVKWFVRFAELAAPDTWSFEQVDVPCVRRYLERKMVPHSRFDFSRFGVPQTRKRILAGTGRLVHTMQTDTSLREKTTPLDILSPPRGVHYVRASGGKCVPAFYRPLDKPTWSLLCATKPVFADKDRKTVRVMNTAELLLLQTFPSDYNMSSASVLGSEHDRVRLVGNAVPPIIARKLLAPLHAPGR